MTSTNDDIREQIFDLLRNRLRLQQRQQDLEIDSVSRHSASIP